MTFFEQTIAALETELRHREIGNRHLTGIPRRRNETRIEQICDELTDLHIRKLEGALDAQEGN